MDTIWWILIGLAVFGVAGFVTFDALQPNGLPYFVMMYIGATLVAALYVSIEIVEWTWWKQLLYWAVYLFIVGLIDKVDLERRRPPPT